MRCDYVIIATLNLAFLRSQPKFCEDQFYFLLVYLFLLPCYWFNFYFGIIGVFDVFVLMCLCFRFKRVAREG